MDGPLGPAAFCRPGRPVVSLALGPQCRQPRSPQPCKSSTKLHYAHSGLPCPAAPWTSHNCTKESIACGCEKDRLERKRGPSHSEDSGLEARLWGSSALPELGPATVVWTPGPLQAPVPLCLGIWKATPASHLPPCRHGVRTHTSLLIPVCKPPRLEARRRGFTGLGRLIKHYCSVSCSDPPS